METEKELLKNVKENGMEVHGYTGHMAGRNIQESREV
jgi:hypothetical protein